MNWLRKLDWEAIVGIIAAGTALLLHLLHVADEGVLLAVALVILALLLLRDLRRESRDEEESEAIRELRGSLARLESTLQSPEIKLIGPRDLRRESERFAREAQGETLWFNVCLSMFEPQDLFDVLLKPALENPRVTSVQFVLNRPEQQRWGAVRSKADATSNPGKLLDPRWAEIEENVSFVMADDAKGRAAAHVSFWGEPFMSRQRGVDIPRYVLHVLPDSALIGGLLELERSYRKPAGSVT